MTKTEKGQCEAIREDDKGVYEYEYRNHMYTVRRIVLSEKEFNERFKKVEG